MKKVALNGFGRIGKNFLRAWLADSQAQKAFKIAAINLGPDDKQSAAHSFAYDTLLRAYPGTVGVEGDELVIDSHRFKLFNELSATNLPWKSQSIDWVVDASGKYTDPDKAQEHIAAGAKQVLISAPAKGAVTTIVPGVNDDQFNPSTDTIVSLASCTTNALAPMIDILKKECGYVKGFMTTIHAYTNSQVLLDKPSKDPRRGRAAAQNIIPTTTGASKSVVQVLPEVGGTLEGVAIRVPVANVSLIDLVFESDTLLTSEQINNVFSKAAQGSHKGIVGITMEPLVSSDFMGNSHSVVIDAQLTATLGTLNKVFGWYDNEWAYSVRLKDFLVRQSCS